MNNPEFTITKFHPVNTVRVHFCADGKYGKRGFDYDIEPEAFADCQINNAQALRLEGVNLASGVTLPAFWEIRFRWLKLIAFYRIYL